MGISKKTIIIISIVLAICLAIGGVIIYFVNYEPDIDPTVPFSGEETYEIDESQKEYNFLLLGYDRASMSSDVIMLANYNIETGDVSLMQIPRDTIINCDDRFSQISNAFCVYYAAALENGEKDPVSIATQKIVHILQSNLCLKINFSAAMSLEGFVNIVDAIGGIEVDVPCDMDYEDPAQDLYIHIKKGYQTLNGEQAEGFVRFRYGYKTADLGRENAQKIFLSAFLKKVLNNMTLSTVATVASEVLGNLTTNLRIEDMVYFGKHILNLKLENVRMMTMPGGTSLNYRFIINRKTTIEVINQYFNLYSSDITDTIFDPSKVFCSSNEYDIIKYYDKKPEAFTIYDAQSIIDESINIPTKEN